jgi:hypothetical protein
MLFFKKMQFKLQKNIKLLPSHAIIICIDPVINSYHEHNHPTLIPSWDIPIPSWDIPYL